MRNDASRLRVAIADPTHFGQTVLADLLTDEGVREIVKFGRARTCVRTPQRSLRPRAG